MAARKYATQDDIAEIKSALKALAALVVAPAPTPVVAAPVQAKAEAPLYVSDKTPCALHEGCTRKLSNPSGSHEACAGKGDPMHDKLRPAHRHF